MLLTIIVFPLNEKLSLPVFDFKTNSFTGENIGK